jgi:hypothetical protein
MKAHLAMDIHSNLTKTLATETAAYSTMNRYLHMTSFINQIAVKENQNRSSSFSKIDDAILKALEDELFSSAHDLTIHRYPTGSLGLTI